MPFTCLFSSGLGAENAITSWRLPSVDQFNAQISSQNDGSLPLEPWQRISQDVFEAWLKEKCDDNPTIDLRFGWKAQNAEELDTGAKVIATNVETGERRTFWSRYAVGCDGASSKIRQDLGIEIEGGPM
jgi:FAD-dependent monooxygenase